MKHGALAIVLFVLPACTTTATTAEKSEPAHPPNSRGAWCASVPLTADASGDLTGKANTEDRVLAIKNAIEMRMLAGCPGTYGIGMTTAGIAKWSLAGSQGPVPGAGQKRANDAKDWVINVFLDPSAPQPVRNPLYADGVPVYFEASGGVEPL